MRVEDFRAPLGVGKMPERMQIMREKMSNEKTVSGTAKPEESADQNGALMTTEIVVPNIARAKASMAAFEQLKKEMLEENKDYVNIKGKLAITRAGFSKIALAFGVTTEVIKITRIPTDNDYIVHVVQRATLANGRYADGSASCSKSEFEGGPIKGTIANVEAKAATRARSRAVADCVGGGVLSTDELSVADPEEPQRVEMITQPQMDLIRKLGEKHHAELIDIVPLIRQKGLDQLTKSEASEVIKTLKEMPVAVKA